MPRTRRSSPPGRIRRARSAGSSPRARPATFFDTAIELANPDLAAGGHRGAHLRQGRRHARPARRARTGAAIRVGPRRQRARRRGGRRLHHGRERSPARRLAHDGLGLPAYVAGRGYGMHIETAAPAPSPTWIFAEGSTVLDFDLFYLLQNPQPTTTHATVRYLLPSGAAVTRTYDLPPGSRTTDPRERRPGPRRDGRLRRGDGRRADRRRAGDVPHGAERAARGRARVDGRPGAGDAVVPGRGRHGRVLRPLRPGRQSRRHRRAGRGALREAGRLVVTRQYIVRAHSRFSVYVDAIDGLENTSVATTITSTNAVPIVVERSMYWPGNFFDYYEWHGSAGSTDHGTRWVVAGAESSDGAEYPELRADRQSPRIVPARARLTFLNPAPLPAAPPIDVALPPNSRTTVAVPAGSVPSVSFFGVLVESVGASARRPCRRERRLSDLVRRPALERRRQRAGDAAALIAHGRPGAARGARFRFSPSGRTSSPAFSRKNVLACAAVQGRWRRLVGQSSRCQPGSPATELRS